MTEQEMALVIVDEEIGELMEVLLCVQKSLALQKRVHKTLRFGPEEVQKGQYLTNAQRFNDELNDLLGALEHLGATGFPVAINVRDIAEKMRKIRRYNELSRKEGCLDDTAS